MGLRRPVREADNLTTFMCRMSWKSGSLNLLEPSGPHRACYGTHLLFTCWFYARIDWAGRPRNRGSFPILGRYSF